MRTLIALAFILTPAIAGAQVVMPAVHCPLGYAHRGGFCVQGIHRIPFADFMRGGRYWGRPFPHHGTVIRPGHGAGIGHGPVQRPTPYGH